MDGRRSKGKLQTVSVTGGMMALLNPLTEGDFVEIAFQTPAGIVQGMAEMLMARRLFSMGYQQPFRFVALGDNDHQNLRRSVETSNDVNFLGMKTSKPTPGWMA
jgi:hypothetical protein